MIFFKNFAEEAKGSVRQTAHVANDTIQKLQAMVQMNGVQNPRRSINELHYGALGKNCAPYGNWTEVEPKKARKCRTKHH